MKSRLEVFVAAAQFSSLTKAARSLAISQPAVSKNIKELESEYNVTLFKRGAGKMELTPEGERFLVHARKILGCYRDLNEDLSYFSGGDISAFRKIKVGATAFLAAYVLPDLIEKYHSLFVNTEIELSSGSEDTELFFTENGETVHASGESDFIDFPLFKYDLILVAGRKNGIDMSSDGSFMKTARYVELDVECCSAANSFFKSLRTFVKTDNIDCARAMVASGENYCMAFPSFAAEKHMTEGKLVPVNAMNYMPVGKEAKLIVPLSNLRKRHIENFTRFVRRSLPGI